MEGENFVSLKGKISWPDYKLVGQNETPLFKAKLGIDTGNGVQYIKISAWSSLAEALSMIEKDAYIHIHGHIEERTYDGACKHCKGLDKKYWTEVVVDNFQPIKGGY